MAHPTRDRLLEAAGRLFYVQGITSTGIEAVVQAAGVTKPTLYAHFDSKTALVAAVLQRRHAERAADLEAKLAEMAAQQRPLGVFAWLDSWYADQGARGCAFLNAAAELGEADGPGRAAVEAEKTWLLELLSRACAEAGLQRSAQLGSQLLLLVDGVAGRVVVGGPGVAAAAVADARTAASVLIDAARA